MVKKLKKYIGMTNIAIEIMKRLRISKTQSHPQHKIEKYESWDW